MLVNMSAVGLVTDAGEDRWFLKFDMARRKTGSEGWCIVRKY